MKSKTEHLWFSTKERVEFINLTPDVERLVRESGVRGLRSSSNRPKSAPCPSKSLPAPGSSGST